MPASARPTCRTTSGPSTSKGGGTIPRAAASPSPYATNTAATFWSCAPWVMRGLKPSAPASSGSSKHGVPKAIRSDNGPPFACSHALLGLHGLASGDGQRHRTGAQPSRRPHTTEATNGSIESRRQLESASHRDRQAAFDHRASSSTKTTSRSPRHEGPAEVSAPAPSHGMAHPNSPTRLEHPQGHPVQTRTYQGEHIFLITALGGLISA